MELWLLKGVTIIFSSLQGKSSENASQMVKYLYAHQVEPGCEAAETASVCAPGEYVQVAGVPKKSTRYEIRYNTFLALSLF